MEISPYMLSLLLVYSLVFGVSVGVLNDINRIVRVALGISHANGASIRRGARKIFGAVAVFVIALQDILLFAYMGIGVVVLNYYLNRGIFRIYSVVAAAVGFVLYYFTLGRVVMFFAERIIRAVRFVVGLIFRIVTAPARFLFRILWRVVKKLCKKIRFAIAKRKIMRYNKTKREELISLANRGFAADAEILGKGEK